ncbi:hypothetical protein GCM10009780_56250 [Actinomadura alba]
MGLQTRTYLRAAGTSARPPGREYPGRRSDGPAPAALLRAYGPAPGRTTSQTAPSLSQGWEHQLARRCGDPPVTACGIPYCRASKQAAMCRSQVWALLFLGYLAVVLAGVAVVTARRVHQPPPARPPRPEPQPRGRHHRMQENDRATTQDSRPRAGR